MIFLLLTLLFPMFIESRQRTDVVRCTANLRQLYVLCTGFALNNNHYLPQGLSENPCRLNARSGYTNFALLNRYMQINGYPLDLWYCPVLPQAKAWQAGWGNPTFLAGTTSPSYGEFPIGYAYAGNPTLGQIHKFAQRPPITLQDLIQNENVPLAWDICLAYRPSPVKGEEVTAWAYYPHNSPTRPVVSQHLMGGGHVLQRKPGEIRLRYSYYSPAELYW